MPSHKVRDNLDVCFSLNGAGYGSWAQDAPGAPPLARRIAILTDHIDRVWEGAPDNEREALIQWLIARWYPPPAAA